MEQIDRHLSELNEENGDQMKGLCLFSVDCNKEDVNKYSCWCLSALTASESVSLEARVKWLEHLLGSWRVSHFAQIQLAQIRRAEGAQVQVAVVLVCLADVGRHHAVWVVEAAHARPSVLQLHHQTVARHELQQSILTEDLKTVTFIVEIYMQ